jgi:hypothetical protein
MKGKQEEITTEVAVVVLPEEVQTLALRVSDEKREEVTNTLSQIFAGTADWKSQVEAIAVKDPSDKLGMNLAKTARLNAKNARLAAEKLIDQKRDDVQAQMLSFQTEDKLWLKAKQTMQILFKEIESMAEYKEKTAERFELEQHELKVQERLARLASVNPDITRQEIELMSDASFDAFLSGLVKAKEDAEKEAKRVAQELEFARLKKERDDARFKEFAGTGFVFNGEKFTYGKESYDLAKLCELDDNAFAVTVQEATKKIAECRALEIKEKERLAAIAKAKEKELAEEREKAEAEKAKQAEALRIQQEKAAAEKKRQDEIIAKQKAKLEAKQKQELEAKQAEEKRVAAEKAESDRLAKAPKKEKLTAWIDALVISAPVGCEEDVLVADILTKFAGFKKWAKGEIDKL